ncbi:unnamed protein product [Nezara viridula]|uniref:Uncharacterized protein n=1 Tax=Nezara viridula TaxID=85310 RepID=A0A9P0HMI0_NEZVI|nr:unnamed protein product [Nezara viridula]
MGSRNNTWIEPIGYTSSFRPIRKPLRLNYSRDDPKIKETRYQKFHKQNKGRESAPRTFPMELRPREVITPDVASSKNSRYSRSRSTPREELNSYSNVRRSSRISLPRFPEPPLNKEKNAVNKRFSPPKRAPPGYIHSRPSAPLRPPPGYIHASSSTPNRASSGYRHSSPRYRQEDSQYAPRGKSLVRESPLKKDSKSAGRKYEQTSRKRNTSPPSFNSRYYNNDEEYTPRRFLRSRSEPPRRSARIANLKKSTTQQGVKDDERNSSRPRARSRAVSKARDSSPRGSHSESKYKTSQSNYRSASVAPSRYSGSDFTKSSRELQNRNTKKEKGHPHPETSSTSRGQIVSAVVENNEPQPAYDESPTSVSDMFHEPPPAAAERSPEDPNVSVEDTDPTYHEDEENIIMDINADPTYHEDEENRIMDINTDPTYHKDEENRIMDINTDPTYHEDEENRIMDINTDPTYHEDEENRIVDNFNRVQDTDPTYHEDEENRIVDNFNRVQDPYLDYNRGLHRYEEGTNAFYLNSESLFSRREPSHYVNGSNAYRNNGFDSLVPFHRRQMDVANVSRNISAEEFSHYETLPWQGDYRDYLPPAEYAHYQVSSWQNAYNEGLLMQNRFWNNSMFSSIRITCPDGGILCLNENSYCLRRRVSLNNEFET